jgi:hypothetical protein
MALVWRSENAMCYVQSRSESIIMAKGLIKAGAGAAATLAIMFALAPALGAPELTRDVQPSAGTARGAIGYFTPAAGDPKLANLYANGALSNNGFRFTPVSDGRSRAVTVAVRSGVAGRPGETAQLAKSRIAPQMASAPVDATRSEPEIKPVSYSLGSSVGWKRFAVPGKSAEFAPSAVAAAREKLASGIVPSNSKWSTKVQIADDRKIGQTPGTILGSKNMSVDVAGSFRLSRNFDLSAGVRLRSDRDRLTETTDPRHDSQAVYVGTTFRF